jgi:hypothetical protein
MRRILLSLLTIFALSLPSGSLAARPRLMTWSETQHGFPQQPVEQQTPGGATQLDRSLWVVNSTPCLWDADDRVDGIFSGILEAGGSVFHTECLILDKANHLVGLNVGQGLTSSISVSQPIGYTFHGSTSDERCLLSPEYGSPEYLNLPLIEGSNGGHGDRVVVTWTVTNISGHRLGKTTAFTTIQLNTSSARAQWGCES